jgi:hypothetical protein
MGFIRKSRCETRGARTRCVQDTKTKTSARVQSEGTYLASGEQLEFFIQMRYCCAFKKPLQTGAYNKAIRQKFLRDASNNGPPQPLPVDPHRVLLLERGCQHKIGSAHDQTTCWQGSLFCVDRAPCASHDGRRLGSAASAVR